MSYFKKSISFIKLFVLGCLLFSSTQSCDRNNNEPIFGTGTNILAPCENGFADIYPCNDYDLMAQIPLSTFGATSGNDSWGWVDTTTK